MRYYSFALEDEQLSRQTIDEAVEDYLDLTEPIEWPVSVAIYAFEPEPLPEDPVGYLGCLHGALERLDENYGHDAYGFPEATDEMKEAEKKFVAVIMSGFEVHSFRQVDTEWVNVREWVESKRPDWSKHLLESVAISESLNENKL